MATLILDVHPMNDPKSSDEYAREITDGLSVTYTIIDSDAENAVFTGERDQLETIVWRYVTPLEMVKRGEYVNAITASSDDRQDFEHFADIVD